jgi:preprotein translocase subunit YajC
MFFATPAYAQTAAGAGGAEGMSQMLQAFGLPVLLVVLFYVLIIRPQQKRAKERSAMIMAVKRGDTVVLSDGVIGKVSRVDDDEAVVEIATGVEVKVVKSMIGEVRVRGTPVAANESAPAPAKPARRAPAKPKS